MLIQMIFSLIIGILFGIITGLIPGVHINLIGAFLVSFSYKLIGSFNQIYIVIFITSMAITHTFLDFIPSIFLGCPDTDTELSILPGHEMLKKGKGHEAVVLTAYGSIAAIFLLILIALPSILIIPKIYLFVKKFIPYFLILVSTMLIMLEKNKTQAFFIFCITGFLGLTILNLNQSLISQPLLPLLSGLFGGSMLITSIKNQVSIPIQENPEKINAPIIGPLFGAAIASPLCSFLPGLGSGQAAIIGNMISKNTQKGFLVLLGATNTLVMGFSFISLYTISKTRTGAAVALQNILRNSFSWKILLLVLGAAAIAGIVSFALTILISKNLSKILFKFNYTTLSFVTLLGLGLLVFLVSGSLGFLILILSTLTGLYALSFKIKRTNMMGCLLVPVIIFYLF
ncbi:hypothetical protein GF378_01625 [Candidatus Pacearchaeota archaeon]|nr:hypothetical protein [Candidatus Pacearchaeota archaeon]